MTHGMVFGVTMVKDEADIIGDTIHHLLDEGLDGIIVADNNSTDGTRDLLADMADTYSEVIVVDDPEVAYYQSRKMTDLAARAAGEFGAEWIIPFDADEIWVDHEDRVAVTLRKCGTLRVVEVPLFNHFPTALDDEADSPFRRLVWRQMVEGVLPKVAFRWRHDAVIQQGNHSVVFTEGIRHYETARVSFELRHFPYRSFDHFVRKAANGAAAYAAATDLPSDMGNHWREYGRILDIHGAEALREVYERWFYFIAPSTGGLVCDPAPFRRWPGV